MKIEEIFSFENLYKSYKRCKRSKQHKGEVIRFEVDLSLNLYKIIKEFNNRTYKFNDYINFYIYEPKERLIEAPIFKDRIVIKCFCDNVLKPKIENKLIYDNTACRKNKGSSFAIKRLEKFLKHEYLKENNNKFYFLKCDIKKYFPNIDHKILINLLEELDFSKDEMWVIKKIVMEQYSKSDKGLPLGNQSSQWFALFYLNKIDHYIKEKLRIKGYVRYMDDMILIHRDKKYLQFCLKEVKKLCKNILNLELNNKTQIGKVSDGIDFLGYRHILKENGSIIRKLRASSRIRMKRHIKNLNKLYNKGVIDTDYIKVRKNAFYNHIKDTKESKSLKNLVN